MKSINNTGTFIVSLVAPLAGAWIEMLKGIDLIKSFEVAPLAGAWIEILRKARKTNRRRVAPLAGAWIEMRVDIEPESTRTVAPLAGAWIEIASPLRWHACMMSLPSRERGLKSVCLAMTQTWISVAPLAGAWIEICNALIIVKCEESRSPRGSVD